jgi:hypothetical protein
MFFCCSEKEKRVGELSYRTIESLPKEINSLSELLFSTYSLRVFRRTTQS